MSRFNDKYIVAIMAAMFMSACGTATINKGVSGDIEHKRKVLMQTISDAPVQIAPISRVAEIGGKMMPVTTVPVLEAAEWLKKIQIELRIDNPTPLSAVVEKLSGQGVNVVSDLPLNSYTYTGRITKTDAGTALKVILGSVGLDYIADESRKLVVIKPMASRTWFLNIGNRRSNYSSDGSVQATSTPSASGGSSGASTAASGSSPTGAGSQSGASSSSGTGGTAGAGQSGQSINASQSGGTGVASADDFWSSLASEMKNRLTVLMPRNGTPSPAPSFGLPPVPGAGMPINMPIQPQIMQPAGAGLGESNNLYVSRQIGSFSLNPETGAITVQAPHWILKDLDAYLTRVQEMYNTDITFSGELVLVTNTRTDSEGLDLSAFASWASGKYAAVIANNALGGITVSLPNGGVPSVSAGAQPVGGALAGLQYKGSRDTLQVFNAFLSEVGKVSVIQRPLITTTSGVPGVFSKKFTDYYNTVSQQAAAGGTGSAATATQNTLVPIDLGTELRINPRIDVTTGLIRAQLTLNQAIQSGTKNVPQTITSGNSSSTVITSIPLVTRQNLSGEVLLRDGDLIVVGGQTEDNASADENGLPGNDGPLGGIFGTKKATRGAQTYYFALRVAVSKRK